MSKEEIDGFLINAKEIGEKAIAEMGENFAPYLKVLKSFDVTSINEIKILFGMYLSDRKIDKKGYHSISKYSFQNFIVEFSSLELDD